MKLCIALDIDGYEPALALVRQLAKVDVAANHEVYLKIGLYAYLRDRSTLIDAIRAIDPRFRLFLDLKLYDIPNTMEHALIALSELRIDIMTIHASSGFKAMEAVAKRALELPHKVEIFAVSALTSFDSAGFYEIYNEDIEPAAMHMASLAAKAGITGVVCSAHESASIKAANSRLLTLCPGIRPFGESADDQARVATLEFAKEALCDYIVIGRPIYQASNPAEVCLRVLERMDALGGC